MVGGATETDGTTREDEADDAIACGLDAAEAVGELGELGAVNTVGALDGTVMAPDIAGLDRTAVVKGAAT